MDQIIVPAGIILGENQVRDSGSPGNRKVENQGIEFDIRISRNKKPKSRYLDGINQKY